LANQLDKHKLPLVQGAGGKGAAMACLEPGSLFLTAKDQKALDGVAVFEGKLGRKEVTVVWLSQSKWKRVHEPSTGSASKSTLTDSSVGAVVKGLQELGKLVEARLRKGHASPVVYVYDVFTTRSHGAALGSNMNIALKAGKEILLVTTEDTVAGALGPLLGVRSGVKRLLVDDDAEQPAAKRRGR
jgi:hypothetical protein